MSLLVQKYGGTSVDGPERIHAVARRVAAARAAGHDTVVVVSAMGQTTDELIELAREVSAQPHPREMDMLLTAGERISMALLAMALHDLGVEAISFTGSQSGILTNDSHSAARIVDIRPERIRAELARGRVVIVAGFQGVNPVTREITTLGRGGSDTTAVALAVTLGPARCEIYTDVAGVFTADPRIVAGARVLPRVSYAACSAIAHLGGRVLHARSVDLAARHRIPLTVRSSFDDTPGTLIEEEAMEGGRVVAVTHLTDCSMAMAVGAARARDVIAAVAEDSPELDLVAHEVAADGRAVVTWLGSREDVEQLQARFGGLPGAAAGWRLSAEHGAALVSAVGLGLGVAEALRAEAALERARVPFTSLRLTPSALIVRVPDGRCEDAVRALHAEFLETAAG